jgi:aldehyde dehydrogenase (NAD+)
MATTFPHLIDGRKIDSTERTTDINPSNLGDVVGEFARGTAADVEQAIASARAAFEKWSHTTPQERFDVLDRAGTEIIARKEELGRLLSREQGKILADGIGEAARAGYIFKFFAGERSDAATNRPVRPGVEVEVTREPLGVVGHHAVELPARDSGVEDCPALAFGNCVVFKPAGSPRVTVDAGGYRSAPAPARASSIS